MDYKISIIIPCYSVGITYVEEAIQSIENQTYKNWEIIFVDDCSPLQEWKSVKINKMSKDKIKIINNKENLGLGASRNIGFNNSSGDLILFLDADDKYKTTHFFNYIINKFKEYPKLEILIFNHQTFRSEKQYTSPSASLNSKKEILEKFYPKITMKEYVDNIYSVTAWDKAIKRTFLIEKEIYHLNKKKFNEDGVWNYQLFTVFPNVYYTKKIFYKYRIRKNSITDNLSKIKKSYLIAVNNIIEDINDLKKAKWKFYSDETKKQYLSVLIFNCFLTYGYKTTKKWLFESVDKKIYEQLWRDAAKKSYKINILFKCKLKKISPIILKILKIWNLVV